MTTRAAILGLSLVAAGIPGVSAAQDDKVQVQFDRTGYRLTALGAKDTVAARVVDARRRPVPNKPIAYRTSDPNVAVVTQQGVVQSRRVGRTRIWAVSGKDSASALIVVDQWAKTFAFTPATVTFDALGVQQAFRVQLRDATGNAIPDGGRRTVQCRVREDAIVTLSATSQIQSKANGITWIRCTDRGIADSVRVEVRQRPARATIVDKLQIGTKTIPDTFTLRVRALDRRDSLISSARPTWVSLKPGLLSINPVSGFARTLGPGPVPIVAQVGDATDTVTVLVTGTAITGGTTADGATGTTPGETTAREPTLQLNQISPFVGDTVKVTMTAQDAAGAPIQNPERSVALRSSDTTVVAIMSNQRLHVRSSGSAYVYARFSDAGTTITDSMLVIPRTRVGSSSATATVTATATAFVRPPRDTAAARIRNARQIDSVLTSIRESGIGRTTSGRTIAFEALGAHAKHHTRLTATTEEERSGLMFGGMATMTPLRRVGLSGAMRTGTLLTNSATGEDLKVTEVDAQLTLWPTTYFGIGGGFMLRGERTELAFEQWKAANVTVMFKGNFVGNVLSTFAAASFFPYSSFTGTAIDEQPEKSSLGGEAGLDLRFGVFSAGFRYYVERFSFPASLGGDQREDQFSMLRFRLGLKFGK
jgi:hypothetical protein